MERITRYCVGLSYEQLRTTKLVVDAVVRNIEVTGEVAKKIPAQTQQTHP